MLESLVYVSSATRLFSPEALASLLRTSRINNAKRGITGLLLHIGGNFMQALEGETTVVDEVYETILADPRHHQVKILLRMPVAQRQFGDWAMGFTEAGTLPAETQAEISSFIRDVWRARETDNPGTFDGHPALFMLRGFAGTMQ